MDSRHGKVRLKVEGDRLSNLPDDLIHKILSFIGIKQAIETSALSSRWRYLWTSMPCLNFSSEDSHSLPEFSKFVTHVLSARNNQTEVHSVKLAFCGKASQAFVKRILKYAFSHNVQQLEIACLPGKKGYIENLCEYPLSIFSSESLNNLTMSGYGYKHYVRIPLAWYFPALTTLNLFCVAMHFDDTTDKCGNLISNCASLKNLTLNNCRIVGGRSKDLKICHLGLSNLTLEDGGYNYVNVDTPQLKNFTLINFPSVHLVSAPNLASLHLEDDKVNFYGHPLKVSADLLHLEKVYVCFQCLHEYYAQDIVCLLQQLYSVKCLTLNFELIKLLSSSVELISDQPSPFTRLKSLKIYPSNITEPEVTMSTEVKNFLLDSSQDATFTLVSHEEVRAGMNVASAENRMRELQMLLDQWTENSEINTTDMEQDEVPMESHTTTMHEQVEVENDRAQPDTEMKWHFGERMTRIESYWEGLNAQLEKGRKNTDRAISMLREIEAMLSKLPASHQEKLQGRFSGLCAEADTMMDNMMDRMKIKCDKKPQRSS